MEAALASARVGRRTLLVTPRADRIGVMSCNPAIGGVAKGHLVREIDALGGAMGLAADQSALQRRTLNLGRGPAVQATRTQNDRGRYALAVQAAISAQDRLDVLEATVEGILADAGRVSGVELRDPGGQRQVIAAPAVVITTGTFLGGRIFIGDLQLPAGRLGDPPSTDLSRSLHSLGFPLRRFKTGTPPRLDGRSLDYARMTEQGDDVDTEAFSLRFDGERIPPRPCWITRTSEEGFRIVEQNLHRSALHAGAITGTGARYCPSIEDKIVRFPERREHTVFIEPEGLDSHWVYPNGISTSLPFDVQVALVRSTRGLEEAIITQPAYAIEYDIVPATELGPTLETRRLGGLYLAGQINGTSGYEEAAAQGLMAGANAALALAGEAPLLIDRSEGYTGVLIDDLTTRGTQEPYRLFTSRAEHRLLLREDNAVERLIGHGIRTGLTDAGTLAHYGAMTLERDELLGELQRRQITPSQRWIARLEAVGLKAPSRPMSLADWLRRPDASDTLLVALWPEFWSKYRPQVRQRVLVERKYHGYIARQETQVRRFRKMESWAVPNTFDYAQIKGLSNEVRQRLREARPANLGQAGRLPGLTPAALGILAIHLKRQRVDADGKSVQDQDQEHPIAVTEGHQGRSTRNGGQA